MGYDNNLSAQEYYDYPRLRGERSLVGEARDAYSICKVFEDLYYEQGLGSDPLENARESLDFLRPKGFFSRIKSTICPSIDDARAEGIEKYLNDRKEGFGP